MAPAALQSAGYARPPGEPAAAKTTLAVALASSAVMDGKFTPSSPWFAHSNNTPAKQILETAMPKLRS